MVHTQLDIGSTVQEAFSSFILNRSLLALPLSLKDNVVQALPVVHSRNLESSLQSNLNLLDGVLDPNKALYLLFRRSNSIFAITFLPYRARKDECELYLRCRCDLIKLLGEEHFRMSLICKELGEIIDARSWVERDENLQGDIKERCNDACEYLQEDSPQVPDAGYKKNKCRLCDRRMKNKISGEALEALGKLEKEGDCVQISLNSDLVLALDLQSSSLSPERISSHLPKTRPTFTFYRHSNQLLYFIFHSPDSSTVQQRMKHILAIPGLVNVHAEDCGVHVDRKIEIHDPEDLIFESDDQKVGKFRSLYLRGHWEGTESKYEGLERDRRFYDAVQ